jgi:hypothetical protein
MYLLFDWTTIEKKKRMQQIHIYVPAQIKRKGKK